MEDRKECQTTSSEYLQGVVNVQQMRDDIKILIGIKKVLVDADIGIKWTNIEKEIAKRYNIEV